MVDFPGITKDALIEIQVLFYPPLCKYMLDKRVQEDDNSTWIHQTRTRARTRTDNI